MADEQVITPSLARAQFSRQQTGPFTAIPKQLYIGQLTTSSATLYTAPAVPTVPNAPNLTPKTLIQDFWIANTSGSAVDVTLYLVESGGSIGDNRAIMKEVEIDANTSYQVTGNFVLEAGGTIRGLASSNSAITVAFAGTENLL